MTTKTFAREIGAAALHGILGWVVSAAAMSIALWTAPLTITALAAHAIVVPVVFGLVATVYFRRDAPLRPALAGLVFAVLVLTLDIAARALFRRAFDVVLGTWLPAYVALLATWITGLAYGEAVPHAEPSEGEA